MTTIAKSTIWILTFILAFFIQSIELVDLATAFFELHAALIGFSLFAMLFVCALWRESALQTFGKPLIRTLRFAVAITIIGIASGLATFVLEVNFHTAYMLISLGHCMPNIKFIEDEDFSKFRKGFRRKSSKTSKAGAKPEAIPHSHSSNTAVGTKEKKKVKVNIIERPPIVETFENGTDPISNSVTQTSNDSTGQKSLIDIPFEDEPSFEEKFVLLQDVPDNEFLGKNFPETVAGEKEEILVSEDKDA